MEIHVDSAIPERKVLWLHTSYFVLSTYAPIDYAPNTTP